MPNEVFDDLKEVLSPMYPKGAATKIAFSYSYIYFNTWLYRYCKISESGIALDNQFIKNVLGYTSGREMNPLILKDGILDEMGYFESTRNYPVDIAYVKRDNALTVTMYEDVKEYLKDFGKPEVKMSSRFFLKKPIKAVEKREYSINGVPHESNGTFYNVENTHNIPFDAFIYCMSNSKLGCMSFYLYSYLKHKNDLFKNGYDVSIASLAKETGLSIRSVNNYLDALKGYKMVDCIHNQKFFTVAMKKEDRKSNTYVTRAPEGFGEEYTDYEKINVISKKEYDDMVSSMEKVEEEVGDILNFFT